MLTTIKKRSRAYAGLRPAECERAGQTARLIKTAFTPWCHAMAGIHTAARLSRPLLRVIQSDTCNVPGHRSAADGDLQLLKGFEFNETRYAPAVRGVCCRLLRSDQCDQVLVKTDGFMADVFWDRQVERATHYQVALVVAAVPLKPGERSRLYTAATESLLDSQRAVPPLQVPVDLVVDTTPVLYCAALAVSYYRWGNILSYPYQDGRQDLLTILRAFSA
ncbi:MAG TPA: hypothetical protein VGM41_14805 [Chitinophagaceae bacterium]|jgi:hypothetical protein